MTELNLKESQLTQLKNISETLIEATKHFTTYIKDRNLTQSINMFSAIVEGFQSIQDVLVTYQANIDNTLMTNIEKNLIYIAQQLEGKSTLKINQIIQFSLLSNFRNLHESLSSTKTEKKTLIGIYHDKANPKMFLPEERTNALNKEAEHQQTKLLYFTAEDIDFKNETIKAQTYENNAWAEVDSNFPNVIHNTGATNKLQQSIAERKLRRMISFTSFHVGNKFSLPKLMIKQRYFAELLVPFKMVNNKQIVYDYLKQEKIAVVKPILGARGESIYFIQQKGNRFTITDHRNELIYNKDNFEEWIENTLLRKKFSYMVQRYINCHTKDREPYDIRAHMQKDAQGTWQITKIYPRTGNKKSILSNISRDGRTDELIDFLITEFGDQTGHKYDEKLRCLSIGLTEYLDRLHNFSLDELGLDLAIDETERFWLHEANNGPQSTYHEKERAVHTIG